MDWLDLLAVQGTLKSVLQHHSSKASILQHSAFFIVQLAHPYMNTGKTKALTRQTFVGKVMSLLFNMQTLRCLSYWTKILFALIPFLRICFEATQPEVRNIQTQRYSLQHGLQTSNKWKQALKQSEDKISREMRCPPMQYSVVGKKDNTHLYLWKLSIILGAKDICLPLVNARILYTYSTEYTYTAILFLLSTTINTYLQRHIWKDTYQIANYGGFLEEMEFLFFFL